MDPVTGAALIGGAATLGGAVTSAFGASNTNKVNRRENQKNRDFQERLSNTAHQREMADLKRSGLNPLLTGKYGGASTPAGGVPQQSNPLEAMSKAGSDIGGIITNRPLLQAQIANTNSQTLVNSAQASKINAEKELIEQNKTQSGEIHPLNLSKLTSEIELTGNTSALRAKEIIRANAEIRKLNLELEKLEVQRRLWDVANKLIPPAKKIVDKIQVIKRSVTNQIPDTEKQNKTIKILRN